MYVPPAPCMFPSVPSGGISLPHRDVESVAVIFPVIVLHIGLPLPSSSALRVFL